MMPISCPWASVARNYPVLRTNRVAIVGYRILGSLENRGSHLMRAYDPLHPADVRS